MASTLALQFGQDSKFSEIGTQLLQHSQNFNMEEQISVKNDHIDMVSTTARFYKEKQESRNEILCFDGTAHILRSSFARYCTPPEVKFHVFKRLKRGEQINK